MYCMHVLHIDVTLVATYTGLVIMKFVNISMQFQLALQLILLELLQMQGQFVSPGGNHPPISRMESLGSTESISLR